MYYILIRKNLILLIDRSPQPCDVRAVSHSCNVFYEQSKHLKEQLELSKTDLFAILAACTFIRLASTHFLSLIS